MRATLPIGLLSLLFWGGVGLGDAHAAPPAAETEEAASITSTADAERTRLRRLFEAFRAMPGFYAKFREEKHLALLTTPLVNEGTLHFSRGMLARRTVSPVPSVVLVRDGRLEVADRSGRMRIDLASEPVVALFVASFVEILAGDEAALERIYDVRFEGGLEAEPESPWRLSLTPKLAPMTKVVARVEIEGRGERLTRMRVVEVSGDETRTSFSDVDPAHEYDELALARVFSTANVASDAP